MPHKFYTKTEEAWSAMLDAVGRANASVYLESFIFLHDTFPTHNFVDVLSEKSRSGLRVKMVIDATGSYMLSNYARESLARAGVEVLSFGGWVRHIHRKLLIVDERVAFLGGVNIGMRYAKWADLHVRLEGKGIVRALLRSFARSYKRCGGRDPHVSGYEEDKLHKRFERAKHWIVDHLPVSGRAALQEYYKARIDSAKQSVVIITPYFFPHGWLSSCFRTAISRGVSIVIILPYRTDPPIADVANRIFTETLYDTGVSFFWYPRMNHAKAMLVDDEEGIIGSQNIDALSFDYNSEVGVSFRKKDMVRDLKRIIDRWKSESVRYDHNEIEKRWYHPALRFIVFLFQPFI